MTFKANNNFFLSSVYFYQSVVHY